MEKVYVQHKMSEHKDLIWTLIHEQQGYFYVCGYVTGGGRVCTCCRSAAVSLT